MKPCSRRAMLSGNILQEMDIGEKSTIAKIEGSVRRLGESYKAATIILYNKSNLFPIAAARPNENGDYQFLGLNIDLKTFIIAFDHNQHYNAVIQDNVVPK